jgi:hypothetical protein
MKSIKNISIDKRYFDEDIPKYLKRNNIKRHDIINITQDVNFTTLWYWG